MRDAIVQAVDLYPTAPTDPDPKLVAKAVLPIDDEAPTAPARITAACTNCAPGSAEAQQFEDLQIEVGPYRGPLARLDTTVVPGTVVKVWLADSGKPQVQGVTSVWSFTTTR